MINKRKAVPMNRAAEENCLGMLATLMMMVFVLLFMSCLVLIGALR